MFKSFVVMIIFFVYLTSIIEGGKLKSPTKGVHFSISLYSSLPFCFMYFEAILLVYTNSK